jgi:hypothetical protein
LGAALAMLLMRVMDTGMRASKSIRLRSDLEAIRQTLLNRIDCHDTLNPTGTAVLPLSCATYTNVVLKRKGGAAIATAGKIGDWTITSACVGDELLVRASQAASRKDQLSGLAVNDIPSNSSGTKVSQDLFGGTTDFCREYFDPGSSCSGTYDLYTGFDNRGAVCCRRVEAVRNHVNSTVNPPNGVNSAVAQCDAGEYVKSGGGRCNRDFSGAVINNSKEEHGLMQNAGIDYDDNSYQVDCDGDGRTQIYVAMGWTPSHTSPPNSDYDNTKPMDSAASAWAICCPK